MRHVNELKLLREDERDDNNLEQDGFTFFKGSGYGIKETPKECTQSYIMPIFAVYTTAKARIKLWKSLMKLKGVYCDTDSIFTTKKMKNRIGLGELKLEGKTRGLNIFKQKHYSEKDYVTGKVKEKIKGLTLSKDEKERSKQFQDSINGNDIIQRRIIGLKESMRGKYKINEIVYFTKKFNSRDTKREWIKPYSKDEMRDSKPKILGFKNLEELNDFYFSVS